MRPPCLADLEAHFADVTGPAIVYASGDHMRAVLRWVAELELRLGIRPGGALRPLQPERPDVVERRAREVLGDV